MFHDLDPSLAKDVFRHLPLLSFVESYIYLLDERNEALLLDPLDPQTLQQRLGPPASAGCSGNTDSQAGPRSVANSDQDGPSWTADWSTLREGSHWGGLEALLANEGLLTDRISRELQQGTRYWYAKL